MEAALLSYITQCLNQKTFAFNIHCHNNLKYHIMMLLSKVMQDLIIKCFK